MNDMEEYGAERGDCADSVAYLTVSYFFKEQAGHGSSLNGIALQRDKHRVSLKEE